MGKSIQIKFISNIFAALVLVFWSIDAEVKISEGDRRIFSEHKTRGTKGDNITITCKSHEPVHWFDPWKEFPTLKYAVYNWNYEESETYMNAAKFIDGKYKLRNESDDTWSYKISLDLLDVNHEFVGYYFCKKISANILKPTDLYTNRTFLRVYVSVIDKDHPIYVLPPRIDVLDDDGCDIRIPCKSTRFSKYPPLERDNNDSREYFAIRTLIYRTSYKELWSMNNFSCGDARDVRVYVHVHKLTNEEHGDSVKILSKMGTFGVEKGKLELTCTSTVLNITGADIGVKWILPNNNSAKREGRVEYSVAPCPENPNPKIIVNNLNRKDIGKYKCIIQTKTGRISGDIDITSIYDANTPLLIVPPDQKTLIISEPNKTEELFLMSYVANDSTNFTLKYKEFFNEHADREEKAVDDSSFEEDKSKKVQVLNIRSKSVIVVMMRNVTFFDSADYTLIADNGSGKANLTFQLLVKNDPMVTIESNKDNEVNCNVIGYPLPSNVNLQILDDQNKTTSTRYFNMTHITSTINQTSIFLLDQPGDNGQKRVRCVANVKGGPYYSTIQKIELKNKKSTMIYLLVFILGSTSLVVIIIIKHVSPIHKDKYRIKEILNRLGSGHFGAVHRAIIRENKLFGKEQEVAIKTLKPNEGHKNTWTFRGIDQMLAELEILTNLKKHEYIVGFIGAITENVLKGELMLIFEFCDGFNLKDFLQNKIGNGAFVNQVESTHYGYRINKNKTTPSLPRTRNDVEINNRHMPDTQINDNSADTILNVAENQTKIYTTTDLLRWSNQIANGLKFLASHNIVHCDLAARNIILCGNDIKICDFGLARVISKNEIYKMTNGSHFSPRWMAIEAHRNESIFNEKSDVWSFGLVMLEMFSEGQDPFPHISDDDINADTILTEIEAMNDDMSRKPSYTTQKIYNIMLTCWEIEPEERPSFGELERDICDLVNDEEDVEIEDYSENFECDDYERPLANYF